MRGACPWTCSPEAKGTEEPMPGEGRIGSIAVSCKDDKEMKTQQEKFTNKELAEVLCRDVLCGAIIDRGKYLEWRGATVAAVKEILDKTLGEREVNSLPSGEEADPKTADGSLCFLVDKPVK